MATAKLPFDGETSAVIFDAILNRDPVAPTELNGQVPPKLEEVIRTALEKDRDLRYQSAADMRAELKRLKRDTSSGRVALPSTSAVKKAPEPAKKKPRSVTSWLGAAVVLIAVVALAWKLFAPRHDLNLQNIGFEKLTDSGKASQVGISPDGRYIVYVVRQGEQQALWVRQVATRTDVQVLAPESVVYVGVTFSPDGNYIYAVRSDKSTANFRYLFMMPVLGGTARQISRDVDSAPSFSPDGKQLVFARGVPQQGKTDIVMIAPDGTGERVIGSAKSLSPPNAVSWSPDGKEVAFAVPQFRSQAVWVVEFLDPRTGAVKDFYQTLDPIGHIQWLHSGDGLLAQVQDRKQGTGQIYYLSYPDAKLQRVTNDLSFYSNCCLNVTHDDRELVAIQITQLSDIYRLSGGDVTKSVQVSSGEPLVVDGVAGQKLVALNNRGQLLSMNFDGSESSQIVTGFDRILFASVCPDGRHILMFALKDGINIYSAEADGSNLKQLTSNGIANNATCSADSRTLYFSNSSGTQIFSVPIAGGTVTEEKQLPAAGFLAFSRDNKYAAFLHGASENDFHTLCGVRDLASGKTVLDFQLPLGADSVKFAPDGKSVQFLVTRNGARNIWEQPVAGGDMRQVTNFPSGDASGYAWSADGKQLFMSRGTNKSDVVLITNFH
jgi:Tol biopolymer transport system component